MASATKKRRAIRHRARRKIAEYELRVAELHMRVRSPEISDVHRKWTIGLYKSRIKHQQRRLDNAS